MLRKHAGCLLKWYLNGTPTAKAFLCRWYYSTKWLELPLPVSFLSSKNQVHFQNDTSVAQQTVHWHICGTTDSAWHICGTADSALTHLWHSRRCTDTSVAQQTMHWHICGTTDSAVANLWHSRLCSDTSVAHQTVQWHICGTTDSVVTHLWHTRQCSDTSMTQQTVQCKDWGTELKLYGDKTDSMFNVSSQTDTPNSSTWWLI